MPLHVFPGSHGSQRNSVQRSNTGLATTSHTASATPYAYATPTQIIASTPFDTTGIMLRLNTATGVSGGKGDALVSLMIGGAGAEQTLIGPVAVGFRGVGTIICLPIRIPAGSRLSVRHKSTTASKAIAYTLDLYGSPNRDDIGLPSKWVSYGLVDDASNARGTQVTPGNTNAWGSWTALTTSTTYAHSLWVPIVDGGNAAASTALSYRSQFAIASTGDAATEVTNATVWDGPLWATTTAEVMTFTPTITAGSWIIGDANLLPGGIIYEPKPDGASVSMRAMCSGTTEATCFGSILAAVM